MNEQECLAKMVAPSTKRPDKWRGGVIQVWVTRRCDKSCFSCTQGSNFAGEYDDITVEQFEQACISLKDYWGVVGMFGGNPAMHPKFVELCDVMARIIPKEQRGLWCNNPLTVPDAVVMRRTFNPRVSNLNVHLDPKAHALFKLGWPESMPFGLDKDCRHSPPYVAMKDLIEDEGERWNLISNCDINQHWSAMIGVFRGQLRAWFCEVAGAQAMLHQHDPDYPDTGVWPAPSIRDAAGIIPWWQQDMDTFKYQVRKHCHECGVPLRGYGQLAQEGKETETEQVTAAHYAIATPKRKLRPLELVTNRSQLHEGRLPRITEYMQNAAR